MDSGRYAEACPKLVEVTRRAPEGVGAKLTLGDCYEGAGKFASALVAFEDARVAAARSGQTERVEKAREKIRALEKRVAHGRIHVPMGTASDGTTVVRLDGAVVPESRWASLHPIDAGEHLVEVSTPHRPTYRDTFSVSREGELHVTEVSFAKGQPPEQVSRSKGPARPWQVPTGLAFTVAGAATAGAGFALGGLALSKKSASQDECTSALVCTQRGMDLRAQGRNFANAATGLLVLGASSTAAGIVLIATSPSKTASSTRTATSLRVSPTSLWVNGTF